MDKFIAYSILTFDKAEGINPATHTLTGIASTPTLDGNGDVVLSTGLTFPDKVPLLWQHNRVEPIGTVRFEKPTDAGLRFVATLPIVKESGVLKSRLDEAWQSVENGLIWAVSIGIRASLRDIRTNSQGVRTITKARIIELSLVTIPANADARIESFKSLDSQQRAASGESDQKPASVEEKTLKLRRNTMKTLAEQRKDLEARREADMGRMEDILKATSEESRGMTEEEKSEYDGLDTEVSEIDENLTRIRTMETRKAAAPLKEVSKAEGTGAAAAARGALVLKSDARFADGIGFAQIAMCLGQAKGSVMGALEIMKAQASGNVEGIEFLKAAVAAGTTQDTTWAKPLVNPAQNLVSEFVNFLRPQTILGKFGTNGIPGLRRVPFNVSIPAQTSGGEGYWVGEGASKPLTKFDFSKILLGWAKVANIAVLTQELIRFSNPSAEVLVRDELANALRARLDIDFIDPAKAASANVSPASITNGATAIPSSGATDADIDADVRALFKTFIAANMTPANGVWIMNATTALALSMKKNALGQSTYPGLTMNGGVFEGLPVIVSQYVPVTLGDPGATPPTVDTTIVILANASDILLADDGAVSIEVSDQASLQMDGAPTNSSLTPTATQLVSMFQTNSVAIRAERFINWARRRTQAVAYLTGVTWGN